MCGVTVVDAGKSRSTNLGRHAYIMIIAKIFMIIWSSINSPTVICLPTVRYFSWEKPLVKSTAPGSLLNHICLRDLFSFAFIFRSINAKIPCCNFYLFILSCVPARSIYPIYYNFIYLSTHEGLTTPLLCRLASICSSCAGVVTWCCVVLLLVR